MSLIDEVAGIAHRAGNAILDVYNQDAVDVEFKADQSPITFADTLSNQIIQSGLNQVSTYPVVSEEATVDFATRRNWEAYWLVDPLDGTKNFINKQGEFTINIALIRQGRPVLGVVYAPVLGETFCALEGRGAYKNGQLIYNNSCRKQLLAATSISHATPEMEMFFKQHNITDIVQFGASLKICRLAEGKIDVYPRLNGTSEWDTAAAHIVANEAGCKLVDVKSGCELVYNKPSMRNNHFIASRNDLDF